MLEDRSKLGQPFSKEPSMRVRDLMTKQVHACRRQDSLASAARTMWEEDCGYLPVISDGGHLTGVITDRDICMAAYTKGKVLADLTIGDVMARGIYACRASDNVITALNTMRSKRVRRLPVVDQEGISIGVLSIADIIRGSLAPDADNQGFTCKDVIEALAEISEPRLVVAG
jgi:CBS domain-containing protein